MLTFIDQPGHEKVREVMWCQGSVGEAFRKGGGWYGIRREWDRIRSDRIAGVASLVSRSC